MNFYRFSDAFWETHKVRLTNINAASNYLEASPHRQARLEARDYVSVFFSLKPPVRSTTGSFGRAIGAPTTRLSNST
jgi:hypothetical protein